MFEKCLHCDDRSGKPALHVACAAAIDAAVADDSGKRVHRPVLAGLHHVDMRVEMHARPRTVAFDAADDVGARIAVVVAGRADPAHIFDGEAPRGQPLPDILGAGRVAFTRRVDGGKADELGGQFGQFVRPPVDDGAK